MPTGVSFLAIGQVSGEQPGMMALTGSAARNGLQVFRVWGVSAACEAREEFGATLAWSVLPTHSHPKWPCSQISPLLCP